MSRIANRPLTKANDPDRFTDLAQLVAAMLLLLVPAFFYAAQRANGLEAAQRVGALEADLLSAQQDRELLQLELQQLLEPRGLAERAQRLAGLGPATGQQLLVVAPEFSAGNRVLLTAELSDGNP